MLPTPESPDIKKEGNKDNIHTPRGEVILGSIDPRLLSEEEFNQSPDLLYHVAKEPFQYSQDTDYRKQNLGKHSSTLGNGLYATDLINTQDFMLARGQSPVLMRFLPYQAKVFDMRSSQDIRINAPVPRNLFEKYRQFIIDHYKSTFPENKPTQNTPDYNYFNKLSAHKSFLNTSFFDQTGKLDYLDLRVMLGNDGTQDSEFSAYLFTSFMLSIGYDGLICNETTDQTSKESPSYVFYNPKKIGTFETWHQQA